eukprot:SAG31_NODE_3938_length_3735_cov_3.200220_2_plen_181_part_00
MSAQQQHHVRRPAEGKGLLSRFCATIREMRDFNREIYGTDRESVTVCSSPAGFLAGVSADARSIGKQIVEPRQPRLYPRPPNSLTPENDLPSATLPYLTAEEAEHFKTFGYVVKRGLIPRGTLLPWVDKLWAVGAGEAKFILLYPLSIRAYHSQIETNFRHCSCISCRDSLSLSRRLSSA